MLRNSEILHDFADFDKFFWTSRVAHTHINEFSDKGLYARASVILLKINVCQRNETHVNAHKYVVVRQRFANLYYIYSVYL